MAAKSASDRSKPLGYAALSSSARTFKPLRNLLKHRIDSAEATAVEFAVPPNRFSRLLNHRGQSLTFSPAPVTLN
jgi:hypothetical protein